MGEFFIGETNFGVETKKSRFDLKKDADGRLLLTIEIRGNEALYKEVTAEEDSEWSWTLYPPYFYLRDFPVPDESEGKERRIDLTPEDSDDFDLALYLMEHNDVQNTTIRVDNSRLEVVGRVHLSGEPRDFRIRWEK